MNTNSQTRTVWNWYCLPREARRGAPALHFIDGQARHEEIPAHFEVPSADELSELKVGDFIKVGLEVCGSGERFWAQITDLGDDAEDDRQTYTARVENDLILHRIIHLGDFITAQRRHVLAILKEED